MVMHEQLDALVIKSGACSMETSNSTLHISAASSVAVTEHKVTHFEVDTKPFFPSFLLY